MIERERLLSLMRERIYRPMLEDELIEALEIERGARESWRQMLTDLEQEGVIVRTRYGRYGLPEMMNLAVGRLLGNPKGFGFVAVPGRNDDIYVSSTNLSGAMHGDKVMVRLLVTSEGRSTEGEVIRVLERVNRRIVGRFEGGTHVGFCIPDDRRLGPGIVIEHGQTQGAVTGDQVVVRITQFPSGRQGAVGVVEKILGRVGDPGVDVLSVMHQYDLPDQFPEDVLQQIAQMRLEISDEDLRGRTDLRSMPVVTIDGADAKDLDDAISVERLPNGNYRLGVHIADVGHYVREGTPLDQEAFRRGTSVYLLDRVLPMLPPDLSNGICSLTPRVDRLTLSVLMEIDQNGELQSDEIVASVIHSHDRMTYDDVNLLLAGEDDELAERYAHQLEHFQRMKELRDLLAAKRSRRGAIDFEVNEAKVILDADGRVKDIVPREKTLADSIIEEFMIMANEAIAERFYWLEMPFIYRVHEEPDPEKVAALNHFLGAFGLRIRTSGDSIKPRSFQQVLEQVEGRREERLIHRVLLRSMMRARYSPDALGHFGLASRYYSHFTAPIRRYPDLVIHRIIKEYLAKQGNISRERRQQLAALVDKAATQASAREQVATEAERAVTDIKKVQFMEGKEGEEFEAIISGVSNFGLFAELENTVEGLIHISSLTDDYYEHDADNYRLIGRRTRRIFRLGDLIRVKVVKVDLDDHRIDFELVEPTHDAG